MKRTTLCSCTDGCQGAKSCVCYKWNRKLNNSTYKLVFNPESGESLTLQPRSSNHQNKVFSFNECHNNCGCDKTHCQNYLIGKSELKKHKVEIRRVKKGDQTMWGLFAMETIEEGEFFCEYKGEILTKKRGDMRGSFYDN